MRLTYSFAQCQRSRLALRCESTWGGQHDLKSLASFKGRNKRLVWLESDAESLLRTLRNLRAHALDYRLVHVLWDPMQVRGIGMTLHTWRNLWRAQALIGCERCACTRRRALPSGP